MWSSHINQFVHLCTPEIPRVFTNFENQIGDYSIAKRTAKQDFKIIKKIVKNAYNYDLIVQYSDGVYDILHFRTAVNISESYGYKMNDRISDLNVGDTVKKDQQVFSSDNYDEDGIVLTESAAEKLKSYKVETNLISINNNDVFLNLYGGTNEYKSFPRVGESTKGSILLASRRLDYRKILFDFKPEELRAIDNLTDEVTYSAGGKIVDIDLYPNISLADLKKRTNEFSKELIAVYENEQRYYEELRTALEEIIPKKVLTEKEKKEECIDVPIPREENLNKYTDEVGYTWKYVHEWLDHNIQWRYDGKSFENMKIKFTVLKENPITIGCKLTGR